MTTMYRRSTLERQLDEAEIELVVMRAEKAVLKNENSYLKSVAMMFAAASLMLTVILIYLLFTKP